jgi:hypothetical protein
MNGTDKCSKCNTPIQESFFCCPLCGAELGRIRRKMECCGQWVVTAPDLWIRHCPHCRKPTGLMSPKAISERRRQIQEEEENNALERQLAMNYQKPLFGVAVRTVKLDEADEEKRFQQIIRCLLKEADNHNARIVVVSDDLETVKKLHDTFEKNVHRNWVVQTQALLTPPSDEKALAVNDTFQRRQFLFCVSRYLGDLCLKNCNRIAVVPPLGFDTVKSFSPLIGPKVNVKNPMIIEFMGGEYKKRLAAYKSGGATIKEDS